MVNALAPAASTGFQLSASPGSLAIGPSGTGTTTVSVKDVGGFTGSVSLSVSGLPGGVTASFGTNPTNATSVLTLNVSSSAVRGSYLLDRGRRASGTTTATVSLALEVNAPGFRVVASQPSVVLFPGSSGFRTTCRSSTSPDSPAASPWP